MEEKRPQISVIVPVYNVEEYVEKCLASLAAQTYPAIEVLVVDDGSTDGSGSICDAWAAGDRRFQVIHFAENQGISAARNQGIRQASGAYIAFVDSDDYVEPGFLDVLYRGLTEHHADVSICGNEGQHLKDSPAQVLSPGEAAVCLARRSPFLWNAWGKLFPAEMVKEILFDRQIRCGEDILFFYRILKRVRRLAYVPDRLYHYVYRQGSLINDGVTEKRCKVLSVLDRVCEDGAADFPEAEACFRQAAMDTAARLAMEVIEEGADGSARDYLKRFRDVVRRHVSLKALVLSPDIKTLAAELALCGGVPFFKVMAAAYQIIKPIGKNRTG